MKKLSKKHDTNNIMEAFGIGKKRQEHLKNFVLGIGKSGVLSEEIDQMALKAKTTQELVSMLAVYMHIQKKAEILKLIDEISEEASEIIFDKMKKESKTVFWGAMDALLFWISSASIIFNLSDMIVGGFDLLGFIIVVVMIANIALILKRRV